MHVGTRIRSARREMGLSQAGLAELTDVSQPTVANWERGSHAPRHAALTKIAHALNTAPAALLNHTPEQSGQMLSQHQVPILAWPQSEADIDRAPVLGYMTAGCDAARPFAVIAPQDYPRFNISAGATLIFDRAQTEPIDTTTLLYFNDSGAALGHAAHIASDSVSGTKKDAPIAARLIMSINNF